MRDTDALTVVCVTSDISGNAKRPDPRETWVLLNETGKSSGAKGMASDGRVAVVGLDRKGQVRDRVVCGGRTLKVKGKDVSDGARRHALEPSVLPKDLHE